MNEFNMTEQHWPDNFTLSNVARAAKTHIFIVAKLQTDLPCRLMTVLCSL